MVGRIRSRASITVTPWPRELYTDANSIPITPPPIIIRCSNISFLSSRPSLVTTPGRDEPGMGGRGNGTSGNENMAGFQNHLVLFLSARLFL